MTHAARKELEEFVNECHCRYCEILDSKKCRADIESSITELEGIIRQREREAAREALQWLLDNASGGGNWRRIAMQRIAGGREEE